MGARAGSDSRRDRSNRGSSDPLGANRPSPSTQEPDMRRAAILVAASVAAAGCVSVPTAPPELQAVAPTFKPPPRQAPISAYLQGGGRAVSLHLPLWTDSSTPA